MNDILKKFYSFAVVCLWFVGCVGGLGYAFHCKAYFIGLCVAFLGYLAFPELRKAWRELNGGSSDEG